MKPKTNELKQIFACNMSQLVSVLGVKVKKAANIIGVPDKWLWRMTNKGISRIDERNFHHLKKFVAHFAIASPDELWKEDILHRLVTTDVGRDFVLTFRDKISELVQKQVEIESKINRSLINAWTSKSDPQVEMSHDAKIAALGLTDEHDLLRRFDTMVRQMVDEAYERENPNG